MCVCDKGEDLVPKSSHEVEEESTQGWQQRGADEAERPTEKELDTELLGDHRGGERGRGCERRRDNDEQLHVVGVVIVDGRRRWHTTQSSLALEHRQSNRAQRSQYQLEQESK